MKRLKRIDTFFKLLKEFKQNLKGWKEKEETF